MKRIILLRLKTTMNKELHINRKLKILTDSCLLEMVISYNMHKHANHSCNEI